MGVRHGLTVFLNTVEHDYRAASRPRECSRIAPPQASLARYRARPQRPPFGSVRLRPQENTTRCLRAVPVLPPQHSSDRRASHRASLIPLKGKTCSIFVQGGVLSSHCLDPHRAVPCLEVLWASVASRKSERGNSLLSVHCWSSAFRRDIAVRKPFLMDPTLIRSRRRRFALRHVIFALPAGRDVRAGRRGPTSKIAAAPNLASGRWSSAGHPR